MKHLNNHINESTDQCIYPFGYLLKGRVVKKIDIFKELTPRLRTFELRGQGKNEEKKQSLEIQDKQTPHTVLQKLTSKNDHRSLNLLFNTTL